MRMIIGNIYSIDGNKHQKVQLKSNTDRHIFESTEVCMYESQKLTELRCHLYSLLCLPDQPIYPVHRHKYNERIYYYIGNLHIFIY